MTKQLHIVWDKHWWEYGVYLPRHPRWINRLWARLAHLFWLPCPRCGEMFGGHERGPTTFDYPGATLGTYEMICFRHARESCRHDPRTLAGAPIGMYHCPDCGVMVIAGFEHPADEEEQS